MNHSPLVSVIVPVFNGERYIRATLDSALSQTYRDIEVVVVDDGSRDGTRAIAEARAAGDSRVRVLVQANGGVAAARNHGIGAARGDFIAPLDADDVWEPTKIERQVRRMIECGAGTGVVYSWWVWIDADGAVLDCSPRWRIEGEGAVNALLQVNYIGCASIPLFRRSLVEQLGGYDTTLQEGCEDWDLSLRVAERAGVAVVPAVLVAYRRTSNSMSTDTTAMWRSHRHVVERARQRRPHLDDALVRRSEDQFALYLAGVSFWRGAYRQAVTWGLHAMPTELGVRVLPFVLRMLGRRLVDRRSSAARRLRVGAGTPFAEWSFPESLIPYDRVYASLLNRAGGAC